MIFNYLFRSINLLCPGNGGGDHAPRGTYPPYIHFTLQKTNRDTQDALAHLSRLLHVNIKDLSVAGTKDKRGVTVQRVALRRHNKTVDDVWKLANGQVGRRSKDEVLTRRGERGIRIADLNYRKSFLDLGMLKGNAFIITLRCVFGHVFVQYVNCALLMIDVGMLKLIRLTHWTEQ